VRTDYRLLTPANVLEFLPEDAVVMWDRDLAHRIPVRDELEVEIYTGAWANDYDGLLLRVYYSMPLMKSGSRPTRTLRSVYLLGAAWTGTGWITYEPGPDRRLSNVTALVEELRKIRDRY